MNILKKAMYRVRLGRDWRVKVQNSQAMADYIRKVSKGDFSIFYNTDGVRIRGFVNPTPRRQRSTEHPLIAKYPFSN